MSRGVLSMAELGARVREERTRREWSLAELAELAGLSTSFLSLVENGRSDISIGRLARLLDAFELTLAQFTQPSPSPEEGHPATTRVLRRGTQPVVEGPSGIHTVVLGRSYEYGTQRTLVTYEPEAGIDTSDFEGRRSGESFMLVVSGRLVVGFRDGEELSVGKGDSIVFPSRDVVRSRNDGRTRATAYFEHPGY